MPNQTTWFISFFSVRGQWLNFRQVEWALPAGVPAGFIHWCDVFFQCCAEWFFWKVVGSSLSSPTPTKKQVNWVFDTQVTLRWAVLVGNMSSYVEGFVLGGPKIKVEAFPASALLISGESKNPEKVFRTIIPYTRVTSIWNMFSSFQKWT